MWSHVFLTSFGSLCYIYRVGVIVAVLVLVVVVGLLLFAKTSQRWCFASDKERAYKSPANAKPHHAGAGPGPGGNRRTQVHRFILFTFNFVKYALSLIYNVALDILFFNVIWFLLFIIKAIFNMKKVTQGSPKEKAQVKSVEIKSIFTIYFNLVVTVITFRT